MTNLREVTFLTFFLCASIFLYAQAAWADKRSCVPVAKLVLPEGIQPRDVRVGSLSLSPTPELCNKDQVSWPAGITVGILYYQSPPKYEEVLGPKSVTITNLPENTGGDNILRAVKKWFFTDSVASVTTGSSRNARQLTSPLARGEYKEAPFYLLTDVTKVDFYWHGGQAPWNLQILDASGRVVVDESVSNPEASFDLPDKTDGTQYILKVSSADGRALQKPLVLESPIHQQITVSSDPWAKTLRLLEQDDEKNWRLYIWNTIREFPEGPAKTSVIRHLEKDDL